MDNWWGLWSMYSYYWIPFFAFLLDCLIGDPNTKYHPVVGIGRIISFYERIFYRKHDTDSRKFWYGGCTALLTIITAVTMGAIVMYVAGLLHPIALYVVEVFIVYITISPRSLAEAGLTIAHYLRDGDVPMARKRVSWIVGRDTEHLDEGEITRATIETVAENTIDGIISPLFYFIFFGPLGALFYRAANTLDSMIGYKNDKYMYFGRIAARFDDVVNYIPARIGFILFVLASLLLGYDAKKAIVIGVRDAHKHPSPNGGYAEAPVAGALHIRLGGFNQYFNRMTFREYMGDLDVPMKGKHIVQTVRMMYVVTIMMLAITIVGAYGGVML